MNSIKKYAKYLKYKLDRTIVDGTYDPVTADIVSDYYRWIGEFLHKGYIENIVSIDDSDQIKIHTLNVIATGINVNYDRVRVIQYEEFLLNIRDSKLKDLGI